MVRLFSEKAPKVSFERFVGDVSLRLISSGGSNIDDSLQNVMRDIGERYGVGRVVLRWLPIARPAADNHILEIAAQWSRDQKPVPDFTLQDVPWFMQQAREEKSVFVSNISQIPYETDRKACRSRNIESVAAVPLAIGGAMVGGLSLTESREYDWSDVIRNEIESLALIIANAYWSANVRQILLASEARYRGVVQDQSDLIMRWKPDGTVTWVNDLMCDYLGKSRDELIGSAELNFLSEEEWRELEKSMQDLTPANPTFGYQHQWAKPTGKVGWTEWTERGIFDENGMLREVQSVGRDVTQRKLADEALVLRAKFQARLAAISSSLLNVPPEKTDDVIGDALAAIGKHYGFDRVNVTWYDEALPGFGAPIDWQPDGPKIERADPEEFPYGYNLMLCGEITRIDVVDEMPAEASIDQATWKRLGLSSVLCLPLVIEDKVFGSSTFAYREQQNWDDNGVEELSLFANVVTNCAVRQWSTIQLARREKDLERSQRVAKVGSYRLQARLNKDNTPEILNVMMSDQAFDIFGMIAHPDATQQVLAAMSKIHPDDEPRVRETWLKSVQTKGAHTIEYRIRRPDGSDVYVQSKGQCDGFDDNGVINFFGTYKDITEWVESNQKLQTALAQIENLKDRLQDENIMLRDEVRAAHGFDTIVGNSRKLRDVLKSAAQVAPTDVTVLICGETGTGKELVAQSIHDLSDRKDKPMVAVNCAALSTELIESELFGHEKGAFTGAQSRRMGRFEIADGGTLFLDEIGEISGDLQAKLLRVIQEGEFERLGGSKTLNANVRLIAATNRDLLQAMDRGEFRADLYYRINAFPIDLPPLRERKEDIPLLAEHLIRKHAKSLGKDVKSISARTLRYLQEQDWPGNIRELEGVILRALISSSGPVLDYVGSGDSSSPTDGAGTDAMNLLDAQRKHIVDVLKRTHWVIEGKSGAASALGLAPSSLRSKMKRLNIVRQN